MINIKTAACFLAAGVWCLGQVGCNEPPQKDKLQVVRPVKAMVVTPTDAGRIRRYPGKVRANRWVDLSFRVSGPLVQLKVKAGQPVAKDQIIARIDPRDFKSSRAQAQAAYDEARSNFQRYRNLLAKKVVSRSDYDNKLRMIRVAKAALDKAQAALNDTTLRAPFAGVVAKVYVQNHQDVQAKAPIISLQSVSRLEIAVQVPEKDVLAGRLKRARVLRVALDALPGRTFPARFKEFVSEADAVTQTFTAIVTIARPDGLNVLPGMTAELRVHQGPRPDKKRHWFVVPVEVVAGDEAGQSYVWKIDRAAMTVHRAKVTVRGFSGRCITIVSGIKSGDTVVSAGVHRLRPGMKVSLLKISPCRCAK
jgi:RND family efflux transporter MFP subunit